MNCVVFEAIPLKKMECKLKWLKVTANGKHFDKTRMTKSLHFKTNIYILTHE